MTEIKGIKKAVGDFNNWQGAARTYFDKAGKTVWTNIYTGPEQWTEYPGDVVEVASKATYRMDERDDKITMARLTELCREALQSGGR